MNVIRVRRVHLQRPQLIILGICAFFALANVFLLSNYLAAARERDALAVEVFSVERAVIRLRERGANPSAQGPGAPLQPGENPFPRDLPTSQLTNLVVRSAQEANVRVEAMTPQLGAVERLATGAYRTYRLSIRVIGDGGQVADFLGRIERGDVRAWVIDNIQARPTQPSIWDVSFDVTAYAQAG